MGGGEGGYELMRNFLGEPKIKIMFQSLYGGEAPNFSISQNLYRGGKTSTLISLRVECSQLVFGEVTLAPARPTVVSLWSPNTRTCEAYCCKFTGRV